MKQIWLCILVFTFPIIATKQTKIVGLIPVHNEELLIGDCLRALAMITDAIVVLDDASQDGTLTIVKSLQTACNIERIYEKKIWYRDEPGDRNMLLKLGRQIGGTHFVVIDADEMFTATCIKDNFLRNLILTMNPGSRMSLHWIRLWKNINQFRTDGYLKDFIFCDDGTCFYTSDFIHTYRVPDNLIKGDTIVVKPFIDYGLLHFQAVNWRNMQIRQAWYRCITKIRKPHVPTAQLNKPNDCEEEPTSNRLMPCPVDWYKGYTFFNRAAYDAPDTWKEKQVTEWFRQYGKDYFADLAIWHINWNENV